MTSITLYLVIKPLNISDDMWLGLLHAIAFIACVFRVVIACCYIKKTLDLLQYWIDDLLVRLILLIFTSAFIWILITFPSLNSLNLMHEMSDLSTSLLVGQGLDLSCHQNSYLSYYTYSYEGDFLYKDFLDSVYSDTIFTMDIPSILHQGRSGPQPNPLDLERIISKISFQVDNGVGTRSHIYNQSWGYNAISVRDTEVIAEKFSRETQPYHIRTSNKYGGDMIYHSSGSSSPMVASLTMLGILRL